MYRFNNTGADPARRYSFDYSRGADLKVKFDSSKKHLPIWGVKDPLHQVMSVQELRWLWMAVKKSPSL